MRKYYGNLMIIIESLGNSVKLTSEYLSLSINESTIQELKNLVAQQPILREALENLLRWVDFPIIRISDIISVSLEAIPTTPGGEHLFKLSILAKYRGGQRNYEIHLKPDDARRIAFEIESLIQKRF